MKSEKKEYKRIYPPGKFWIKRQGMEKSCLSKKNLSLERANQIVDEKLSEGKLIYFYKCEYCGSYHMTSREPKLNLQK